MKTILKTIFIAVAILMFIELCSNVSEIRQNTEKIKNKLDSSVVYPKAISGENNINK